jgi:hypothetical protein
MIIHRSSYTLREALAMGNMFLARNPRLEIQIAVMMPQINPQFRLPVYWDFEPATPSQS